jgi:hypothetical protein
MEVNQMKYRKEQFKETTYYNDLNIASYWQQFQNQRNNK